HVKPENDGTKKYNGTACVTCHHNPNKSFKSNPPMPKNRKTVCVVGTVEFDAKVGVARVNLIINQIMFINGSDTATTIPNTLDSTPTPAASSSKTIFSFGASVNKATPSQGKKCPAPAVTKQTSSKKTRT